MRYLLAFLAMTCAAAPLRAVEIVFVPDIGTDLPGTDTVLPWNVVSTDSTVPGAYALKNSHSPFTALDGLEVVRGGDQLLSVDVATELGGSTWLPADIILFAGGIYTPFFCKSPTGVDLPAEANIDALFLTGSGSLVVSFDTTTTLGTGTYLQADLVELQSTGPGCQDWRVVRKHFDAAAAGIPSGVDVTGASIDPSTGNVILTFDVPPQLAPTFSFRPGTLVQWDGAALTSYWADPAWPEGSRLNDFSLVAVCAALPVVQPVHAVKAPSAADVTLSWSNPSGVPAYRVCRIDGFSQRSEIQLACASLTVPNPICDPAAGLTCIDLAPRPSNVFYYQVKGLCGGVEGP